MLGVILIWVIMYFPKPRKEKPRPIDSVKILQRKPARAFEPEKQLEVGEELISERIVEQIKARAQEVEISLVRDPFEKLQPKTSGLVISDLVFSGVIWDKERPLALINDQVLGKGDTISGFEIEDIRADEVILIKGKLRHILRLYPQYKEE